MGRSLLSVLAALLIAAPAAGETAAPPPQTAPAAAPPQVYVLTMGPDTSVLFRHWGHAALCVDARCFNYGVTDFSRPVGLGIEVLRGEAVFWVGVTRYEDTLADYLGADRSVFRQDLDLGPEGRKRLLDRLAADLVPGRSEYVYDHFSDNCTTRIRDYLNEASGGALERVTTAPNVPGGLEGSGTWRTHVRRGLAVRPSLLWLTDMGLGPAVDREVTPYEAMFLPEVLRHGLEEALGAPPVRLHLGRDGDVLPRDPGSRAYAPAAAGLAALLVALILLPGPPRLAAGAVAVGAGILTVVGLTALVTGLMSPLPIFRGSLAVLAVLPSDFLLATRHARWYGALRLMGGGLVGAALLFGWTSQPLGWTLGAAMAVVLAIVLRGIRKPHGKGR